MQSDPGVGGSNPSGAAFYFLKKYSKLIRFSLSLETNLILINFKIIKRIFILFSVYQKTNLSKKTTIQKVYKPKIGLFYYSTVIKVIYAF